jgi:hypothetical protein
LACLLEAGCQQAADVIARPEVVSGSGYDRDAGDAGGGPLDCTLHGLLQRNNLPLGLGNVFYNCEWPLDQDDTEERSNWIFWNVGVKSEQAEELCSADPYLVWRDPRPPLPPRRFVFCPEACNLARQWVNCMVSHDPCPSDAGADACSYRADLCSSKDDAQRPPFCPDPDVCEPDDDGGKPAFCPDR